MSKVGAVSKAQKAENHLKKALKTFRDTQSATFMLDMTRKTLFPDKEQKMLKNRHVV